ncbi:metallophosphoesterase family protein [Halochromatium salexigens]|uniref:DNA repair exonuclease n=1 Tax=Halochromatium salexigens TaxID=49447 RepID=A0AAJ0UET7_HALSE|nr:DNA repair exonuclease [Halochromatium salexigens]MBK5930146.1 DNA repair exonuclease [Halochromatium salexigens]
MPRFLHTADWQIGRQYGRFKPEDAAAIAEARFTAVERLAALASAQQVDAVLVAGDVFDAQTVSDRTIRRLFNALQGYAGPWLLLPGNHDAALAESVWSRARRIGAVPANVELLLEPEPHLYPEAGFAILPAPLTQRQTMADLTAWFDQAETPPELLRIGLAHGSVQGLLAEEIDSANPIAAERAERARLDYLALGDWHGLKQIDARTWYSGTPEQERFKDNGAGQALIVEIAQPTSAAISPAAPRVTPAPIGTYHWQRWQADLRLASDAEALIERLQTLATNTVLRLQLSGTLDLSAHQRLQAALGVAEGRCRSLEIDADALRLTPTDADLAALQVDGYLGEVVAQLRERQQGDEGEIAREALVILADLLREQRSLDGEATCS